jgi:hypothetical protein
MPPRYLVISPVKDEEKFVEHTLGSMVAQTIRPVCWFIVDDGSTDRTPEIIERYRTEIGWIQLLRNPPGQRRQPGSAVINAFNRGYEAAKGFEYDFVVKLDCDLSFEADYFERLLSKFESDSRLGIASGVYLEAPGGTLWSEVEMPPYHAAGASKILRRECFEQIGGFIPYRGWDTVDEIRAMSLKWRTCHFPEAKMRHWKLEGAGIGRLRTHAMHGEIYYLTSGSKLFFFFKVLHRMMSAPFFIGGIALLWGYFRLLLSGTQRLVTQDEARCYRAILNGRITGKLSRLFKAG